MAASLLIYGRIKGVQRPAIAVSFPTQKHPEVILDVGANVDCSAEHLVQFAHLGRLYFEFFWGAKKPRISLLNIGEESAKGNSITKVAHKLLAADPGLNFTGNIERKDVLKGITDVVVCEGFVGNVMLKTIEGAAISKPGLNNLKLSKSLVRARCCRIHPEFSVFI